MQNTHTNHQKNNESHSIEKIEKEKFQMDEDAQNRKKLLTQYTNEVSVNIDTKKKKSN